MRGWVVAVVALVVLGANVSQGAWSAPQAPDPQKVAEGQKLYETLKCSTCHSIAGKGSTRYPLDGVGTKFTVADIRAWMVDPLGMEAKLKQPPRMKMSTAMRSKKLTDADVEALVAYMQTIR